jgi:hypothetical protein
MSSSKHRRDSSQEGQEGKKKKAKEEDEKVEETKEEEEKRLDAIYDPCAGSFPDSCYPPPPVLEEERPEDLPLQVDQDEPCDEWYCKHCRKSPCLFLQWEEELDAHVDIMYPEVSNVAKRFHMYRYMSRQLHGPLKKGERKRLPECFETGLRAMFPSDRYVGYKPDRWSSGGRNERAPDYS